ncbi:MAG: transcriptional regulator [Cyanobacteria bacterium P01_H01_bin.121]
MTLDSHAFDCNSQPDSVAPAPTAATLLNVERERCELLSAYLDGEVTASERQQVEYWLSEDANFLDKYHRLLRLRDSLQALVPVSVATISAEATVQAVLDCSTGRSRRRGFKLGAAAAVVIGMVTGAVLAQTRWVPQIAQTSQSDSGVVNAEPVVISLDQPIIPLSANTVEADQLE